ncbi:MAG: N-acetyltransferase, partial [Lachnospiraceae bacterium]|nr:N-acetyltransferase [Lachnospiraceae bacterium]
KDNGDEPIGDIAVVEIKEKASVAHIGYCISADWWNKGITSEALQAVIDFLFDVVGFNRVEARHDSNNPNSGTVMQKCGMKYEGTLRSSDLTNQGICDACYYGLLKAEHDYLRDPCGTLSIPYWKSKTQVVPDTIEIIHSRDWTGQYSDFQRFFRVKHSLNDPIVTDFDYDTISIEYQAKQLAGMINASYGHEGISVSEHDILQWKTHETFREDLCIYINADGGKMAASGIAEYDENCREGIIEWVQVLPEYRSRGLGQRIVTALLSRLKSLGADFVTVSGNLDNPTKPLELYRRCGFEGDDVWYICRKGEAYDKEYSI